MADYKKFRMVGPVAVYHHKETGKLATKVDDYRFKEWASIEEIEAMVREKYPSEYVNVIQIDSAYGSGNHSVRRLQVVWDRKRSGWLDTKTGSYIPYSYDLIVEEEGVYEALQQLLMDEVVLRDKLEEAQKKTFDYFHQFKGPKPPK